MSRRARERQAEQSAMERLIYSQDWKEERDTEDDEYPEPEPEEQQRGALQ